MTNEVHQAAETFRSHLMALGVSVGPISHSTNRNGENSSYFDALGVTVRISDHDCNQAYRIREASVHYLHTSAQDAEEFAARMRIDRQAAENEAQKKQNARDEFEAKAKAAWLTETRQNVKGEIIARLYPWMGRADRQEVARRWSK